MISHLIFLYVSIRKGPSSGNQTEAILYKTNLATSAHSWCGVQESNT